MKIIVRKGRGGWRWAFVARNGRQIANNETHPTRGNAMRAAKGVVSGILGAWQYRPRIVWTAIKEEDGVTALYFGPDLVQEA